ncbi:hypothetical protein SNE40_021737 [Patella caerulea]
MDQKDVFQIYLPRVKIENTLKLKPILKLMGINQMFDQFNADLSGMTGRSDLYVDDAIQKAVLQVNEKGTEASAATGFGIAEKALFFSKTLMVNHPFMFVLRDKTTGMDIFHGRYTDPRA